MLTASSVVVLAICAIFILLIELRKVLRDGRIRSMPWKPQERRPPRLKKNEMRAIMYPLTVLTIFVSTSAFSADLAKERERPEWDYWVDRVEPNVTELDNVIRVDVVQLSKWLKEQNGRNELDLVPFFNGIPLKGIHPESVET